jgi:hypothetical protein
MANLSERQVWRDVDAGKLVALKRLVNLRHRVRVRLSEARRYAQLQRENSGG